MSRKIIGYILTIAAGVLLCGCANIGNPSGGPRDEDPPYLVAANPPDGSRNVERTSMTLTFNELVNVTDAFNKVVVSPAGRPPRVTSLGKRVTVRFDSLKPNTTYTVDFADAIEDNNEANKLRNFAYTFSTGETLDSLRISGMVLGARDLEPRPGILVGVIPDMPPEKMKEDSIFTRIPLLRVGKADDRGRFIIRGLAPGDYRVFALKDNDADFRYSADTEEIGFYQLPVTPATESVTAFDTTWNIKTASVDTVVERLRTRYLPNDLLIRSFVSLKRTQYISRYERNDSNRLFLKFNAPLQALPPMRILGDDMSGTVTETRADLDSLNIWLPERLAARDSLFMAVDYIRSERGKAPYMVTDTLKVIRKRLPVPKKKKKERKISAADSLARITTTFRLLGETPHEVWQPLEIESATPLARLDTTAIHLSVYKDSVWRRLDKGVRVYVPDTLSPRRLAIDYAWDYGGKYRLETDSLAGTDIYGRPTLPLEGEVTVRNADQYCSLTFNVTGLEPGMPAFVELLDTSDKVVRTSAVEQGRAFFPFLTAGKYYARIIEDYNGNGVYDSGDFETGRQPETAYYYPKAVNIKKNWDKEESWDVFAMAIDRQKPEAILKNKPEASKNRARKKQKEYDSEEEEEPFDPTANPFEERRNPTRRNY